MSKITKDEAEAIVKVEETGKMCPPRQWDRDNICDVSILTYRYNLRVGDRLVECTLRYRVERCTEDYVLSDLVHSTTLFPGEEVFLSVRNRHSVARFTEDSSYSASQVSRSSDRIWMETFKSLATDFNETSSQSLKTSAHSEFSETGGGGSAGLNLGFVSIGGGASHVSGEFDASSSAEFFSELNQHLRSSFHQTNQVARDSSSVSITQVNSHRESTAERDDELKVSTRRFKNINQCHTVTHYFFQIAKRQRVKIELVERTCRAVNEFANSAIRMKPMNLSLATNRQVPKAGKGTGDAPGFVALAAQPRQLLMTRDQQVMQNLGRISLSAFTEAEKARREAIAKAHEIMAALPGVKPYERVSIIPTEALYVESELGDCMICEPYVVTKQKLELERLALENRKMRREINLMDQYKDYRCCDGEEVVDEDDED
jgi:hypothetical protein